MKRLICMLFVGYWLAIPYACDNPTGRSPISTQTLKEGFAQPPQTAWPKVYWWWLNGYTDSVRIKAELRAMKEAGISGVDIFEIGIRPASDPNKIIPAGPAFMSDSSVAAICFAVEEAGKLDMEVGLGLASSWNAGGSWVKPEHAAKTLYQSKILVRHGKAGSLTVKVPFPSIQVDKRGNPRAITYGADGRPAYWEDVAVVAVPAGSQPLQDTSQVIDVTAYFDGSNDLLSWEAPEGDWEIHRFVSSNSGEQLISPSPYSAGPIIDHFDSLATEMHLNYFVDKLKPALGDFSKTALKYFYLASYEAKDFAWTQNLPDKFQALNGYSIHKLLPAIFDPDFLDKSLKETFRFDLSKTYSELMIHNHYGKAKEICNKHGLKLVSESGGPGHMHHIPVETLKALGALDIPRGEFWYKRPYYDEDGVDMVWLVKEIAAASHIYKRGIVEEEAFTSYWDWQEGPADLKAYADRAFCEGMNRLVIHGFTHNPSEFGNPGIVYWAGTHYNDKRVWWPKIRPFNDYLARISYVLQNTQFVADVLYYYGDDIPNLVPPKNTRFKVGDGYDYEIVNTEVLLNELTVEDGEWVLPGVGRYKALSLGQGHRINTQAMKKIDSLKKKGGVVAGTDILRSLAVPPDFHYAGIEQGTLDYIHYQGEDADFYLVRNTQNQTVSRECLFRQNGRIPEIWHPVTGRSSAIAIWEQQEKQVKIPLTFAPHETFFVVFGKGEDVPHFDRIDYQGPYPPHLTYTERGVTFLQPGAYQLIRDNQQTAWKQHLEEHPIRGAWDVTFANTNVQFPDLISWHESNDPNIRYYSGIATYTHEFDQPPVEEDGAIWLDLGAFAEVADVWVNDRHLGISWCPPYRFEITSMLKPGANTLRVEIANNWSNRLTGDAVLGERFTQTNLGKANKNLVPWADVPLKPSGLFGPVKLQVIRSEEHLLQ